MLQATEEWRHVRQFSALHVLFPRETKLYLEQQRPLHLQALQEERIPDSRTSLMGVRDGLSRQCWVVFSPSPLYDWTAHLEDSIVVDQSPMLFHSIGVAGDPLAQRSVLVLRQAHIDSDLVSLGVACSLFGQPGLLARFRSLRPH